MRDHPLSFGDDLERTLASLADAFDPAPASVVQDARLAFSVAYRAPRPPVDRDRERDRGDG